MLTVMWLDMKITFACNLFLWHVCCYASMSYHELVCLFSWLKVHVLKQKRHQGDSPDIHWWHWRQASTSPVNTRAVTLMSFPFPFMVLPLDSFNSTLHYVPYWPNYDLGRLSYRHFYTWCHRKPVVVSRDDMLMAHTSYLWVTSVRDLICPMQ